MKTPPNNRNGEPAYRRIGETPDLGKNAGTPARPHAGAVVLGVDPGLATTGWGVVEKGAAQIALKGFGVFLSPASLPLPERLRHIFNELSGIIDSYRPAVLAIEELFFAKFAVSIAATAQARGVILLAAAEKNVPIVEYNPRAVKMAMTGFGSASKIQMQSMVQRQFRLKDLPRPDDAADALAIALCHLQTCQEMRSSDPAIQRSSLRRPLDRWIARSLDRSAL